MNAHLLTVLVYYCHYVFIAIAFAYASSSLYVLWQRARWHRLSLCFRCRYPWQARSDGEQWCPECGAEKARTSGVLFNRCVRRFTCCLVMCYAASVLRDVNRPGREGWLLFVPSIMLSGWLAGTDVRSPDELRDALYRRADFDQLNGLHKIAFDHRLLSSLTFDNSIIIRNAYSPSCPVVVGIEHPLSLLSFLTPLEVEYTVQCAGITQSFKLRISRYLNHGSPRWPVPQFPFRFDSLSPGRHDLRAHVCIKFEGSSRFYRWDIERVVVVDIAAAQRPLVCGDEFESELRRRFWLSCNVNGECTLGIAGIDDKEVRGIAIGGILRIMTDGECVGEWPYVRLPGPSEPGTGRINMMLPLTDVEHAVVELRSDSCVAASDILSNAEWCGVVRVSLPDAIANGQKWLSMDDKWWRKPVRK